MNASVQPLSAGIWPTVADPGSILTVPWTQRDGAIAEINNFWHRTSGYRDYAKVSAERAWRAQIPLRLARSTRAVTRDGQHRAMLDGFCHPLGNTIALTHILLGEFSAAELAASLASLERESFYRMADEPDTGWRRLSGMASDLLTRVDEARRADQEPDPGYCPEPFVLVSVIQATGALTEFRTASGGDTHRLLDALADRNRLEEVGEPRPLAEQTITGRAERAGGLIYGKDRARVIWAPYRFLAGGKTRWLSCYHRNLLLATALTDAWLGVIAWASGALTEGALPTGGDELVERTARLLGFVYGVRSTAKVVYRSRSTAAQIRDSGLSAELIQAREYIGITEELFPINIGPA
ncbi:hypothetical protein HTZ77_38035 [Nonomuraea sp. SMC257]|uniref:Uncharacterized protein n=1 Tax=Nonomuraea montanisoli TaxID=2741721 RepID=A0A7Y6IGE6_9ACTN|nr:hypothetical protein [Nonomuraea montanisoli]NUW37163.1 hypothetical protein [Nonomuraea montanisoli]